MGHDILVDGYNVIKTNLMFRSLEIRDLAESRALLIQQLKNRYRQTTHRVIVVFDGNGAREQVSHNDHIRIIFSRHGETADSVIARLAAEARREGRTVELYSNDEEVQRSVAQQGGSVRTTSQLVSHLNAAPRDLKDRVLHRQAMRRMYGLDPQYKADDELDPQDRSVGKKRKKGKSSRRYKNRRF